MYSSAPNKPALYYESLVDFRSVVITIMSRIPVLSLEVRHGNAAVRYRYLGCPPDRNLDRRFEHTRKLQSGHDTDRSNLVPGLFLYLSILVDGTKAAVEQPPPQEKKPDAELPRVDIFVTYCGEGIDIVLNTAKAACAQDFPPSLIRVVVLDDNHCVELKDAISALRNSGKYSNLYYASRIIDISTRSANLMFGLSFVSTLPGPTPEYVSVLDVDMIPSPHWLKTVLTSLQHHPTAALVCAAQRFYNIPPSDPLGMTHDLAHIECLIYLQNVAQEAWCTGSGFIVRRTALDQIGGFPVNHMQDDILTSLLLSAKGWKTIYILDSVQWGLAADTMASWIKQRQRWAAGVIAICQSACSPQVRDLPAAIRIKAILWGIVDTGSSLIWTLCMIILPLAVLTGNPLLPPHHLRLSLHLALIDFLAQSTCRYLLCSLIDFRASILNHVSSIWTAPLRLAIACRYIVPGILGRPLPRFTPTGIPATGDSERTARKQRTSCLQTVLWECGGWMHVLCLGVCLAGLGACAGKVIQASAGDADLRRSLRAALEALMVRVGWPPLFLLFAAVVKNACVPIAYAVAPPRLLERTDMLGEDKETGVWYPREGVKRAAMKRASQGFWWGVAGVYLVVVVGFEAL